MIKIDLIYVSLLLYTLRIFNTLITLYLQVIFLPFCQFGKNFDVLEYYRLRSITLNISEKTDSIF